MSAAEFSLLSVTGAFVALVVWVYWPSRRTRLESYGAMPLEDESDPADHAEQPVRHRGEHA